MRGEDASIGRGPRRRIVYVLASIAAMTAALLLGPAAPAGEFDAGSGIELTSLTVEQVENVAVLGMVWGFLKYHHPAVAAGGFQWDGELFRALPDVLAASDLRSCQAVLCRWVDRLGVPEDCDRCARAPSDVHLLPRLDWTNDVGLLGPELAAQLQEVYRFRYAAREQFYVSKLLPVGNLAFDRELDYADQRPPDPGFRILALLRLWNVIEYWFPYRDQIDGDWHAVLREMLPRFVAAADWDAYRLALLALLACVGDAHANLWSELDVRPPRGDCCWPVVLRFVEGSLMVTAFTDDVRGPASGLEIGDVIRAVDGRFVDALVEAWSPYYCASNEAGRLRDIARYFPRGECGETELTIERGGDVRTVVVRRFADELVFASHDRPGEAFQLLSPEVAYLKLSSVRVEDVPKYVEQAAGTRGLVIDIRNYPSGFVVLNWDLVWSESRRRSPGSPWGISTTQVPSRGPGCTRLKPSRPATGAQWQSWSTSSR